MSKITESTYLPQGTYSATITLTKFEQNLSSIISELQEAQAELISWGAKPEEIFLNIDQEYSVYEVSASKEIPAAVLLAGRKQEVESRISWERNALEKELNTGEERFIKSYHNNLGIYKNNIETLHVSQKNKLKKLVENRVNLEQRKKEFLESLKRKLQTSSEVEFQSQLANSIKNKDPRVEGLIKIESLLSENAEEQVKTARKIENIEADFKLMLSVKNNQKKKKEVSYRITKEQFCESLEKTLETLLKEQTHLSDKKSQGISGELANFELEKKIEYINWAVPKVQYHVNNLKRKIASFNKES